MDVTNNSATKVMVLAGGPDRERPVSLQSGASVAAALREAGHKVLQCDPCPDDASYMDAFEQWGGHVVFPVLHGSWGEGGPLQKVLQERGVAYVGCRPDAADLCMDKFRTKQVLVEQSLPTAPFEMVSPGTRGQLQPPYVIKVPREGSSVELHICHDQAAADAAWQHLGDRYPQLMVEQFVAGVELTIGVIGGQPLAPIQIVPATDFYDYDAKYERDDTQYLVGAEAIDLPAALLDEVSALAKRAYDALGCRHLSRVDFIIDGHNRPQILEVNTMPGFTSHSLLPMAASHGGFPMPVLVDRLVRMAVDASF